MSSFVLVTDLQIHQLWFEDTIRRIHTYRRSIPTLRELIFMGLSTKDIIHYKWIMGIPECSEICSTHTDGTAGDNASDNAGDNARDTIYDSSVLQHSSPIRPNSI